MLNQNNHVVCIEASDCVGTLTESKHYAVLNHSATGWQITNDRGEVIWVGQSCFRLL